MRQTQTIRVDTLADQRVANNNLLPVRGHFYSGYWGVLFVPILNVTNIKETSRKALERCTP
jgi:hypothetical protein